MKLRDKLWIWGHDAGCQHANENNAWKLPGVNKMGPEEACQYLGIPNCCRVVFGGSPTPPFDKEAESLDVLKRVVWSIIGDAGSTRNNESTDLDEIIRIAKIHPNVTGAIMDDFMNPSRMPLYPPERLAMFRDTLHEALPERPLDFWTVLYVNELKDEAIPYLDKVDYVSLWTMNANELHQLPENFARAKEIIAPEKHILAGCYLWDYGNCAPMPMELMKMQLEYYLQGLRSGEIDGVVFCSNNVVDLGLDTVEYTRQWIEEHGDEELGEK